MIWIWSQYKSDFSLLSGPFLSFIFTKKENGKSLDGNPRDILNIVPELHRYESGCKPGSFWILSYRRPDRPASILVTFVVYLCSDAEAMPAAFARLLILIMSLLVMCVV